jgi:hypothetical protein
MLWGQSYRLRSSIFYKVQDHHGLFSIIEKQKATPYILKERINTDGTKSMHTSREITASNSLFSFTSSSAYK